MSHTSAESNIADLPDFIELSSIQSQIPAGARVSADARSSSMLFYAISMVTTVHGIVCESHIFVPTTLGCCDMFLLYALLLHMSGHYMATTDTYYDKEFAAFIEEITEHDSSLADELLEIQGSPQV